MKLSDELIAKAAEDNPDLLVDFIIETLIGIDEDKAGFGKPYKLGG